MRIAIFSTFSLVGILLLVAFLQGYSDTSKQVPVWWWALGGPGIASLVAAFLVAVPARGWRWMGRFVSRLQPISYWRSALVWKREADRRISFLETVTKPLETATRIQERRRDSERWKASLEKEIERLRSEVGRLESNLASVQERTSTLANWHRWLAEQTESESK